MSKGDIWCTGCGSIENLSHSHLVPRSVSRDLIIDPDNITYHCLECHDIWEHGKLQERKMMNDFEKNMEYIKKVNKKFYLSIMIK